MDTSDKVDKVEADGFVHDIKVGRMVTGDNIVISKIRPIANVLGWPTQARPKRTMTVISSGDPDSEEARQNKIRHEEVLKKRVERNLRLIKP
jgi:hypothetical protein